MAKRIKLSDEIRRAVDAAGDSRVGTAKAAGFSEALLCRFMSGESGLSIDNLDRLAAHLNLRIVQDKPKKGVK